MAEGGRKRLAKGGVAGDDPVFLSMSVSLRVLALLLLAVTAGCFRGEPEPVRVGVLHSATGTMAMSEAAVQEATLLAIGELNAAGGLLGRPVEAVVADGRSDPEQFAAEARRLIGDEGVSVIFGCWTSSSRKAVKPVVELNNHLLFYPLQYEGLEQSPNIVYTGAAPNQQVMPAVSYALRHFGPRVFLVGSDYIFPRAANRIIRDQVAALGGEVVGEEYVPLGATDFAAAVSAVAAAQPDVILNTVNGDSNVALFRALRAAGITPERTPTVSFSLGENELAQMGTADKAGDYAAWNYFQAVDTAENRDFIAAFRERYGAERVTSDPMEAAYFGVLLWARAVEEAGTTEPAAVLAKIRGEGMHAPGGLVYVDGPTQHTWKHVRLGRIRPDGQFDIVWSSENPVRPMPFPLLRARGDWEEWLRALHEEWGGQWINPRAGEEERP